MESHCLSVLNCSLMAPHHVWFFTVATWKVKTTYTALTIFLWNSTISGLGEEQNSDDSERLNVQEIKITQRTNYYCLKYISI